MSKRTLYRNGEREYVTPHNQPKFFRAGPEFRPPRKGEYYLSGAIPCAYLAPNDLSTPYRIAIPVEEPSREILRDGVRYVRSI